MQTSKRAQVFNEINITPLTDIFLVLLIIMMVVAPMIQHMRADISPPKMENGAAVAQGPLTVEITKEGDFYVEGAKTEQSTLKELLIEKAKNGKEKNV
ncbi:MAG: biopolymer transporter ExbD, partial [Cyanobacteria bacterium]|nr:biopolymer transporter ExbD [Cyanobacteriota bacterium]